MTPTAAGTTNKMYAPSGDTVRAPTSREIDALRRYYHGFGLTWEDANEMAHGGRIVVFPNYISDGPGYAGPVALVLYGGGPECVESFTFRGDGSGQLVAERRSP